MPQSLLRQTINAATRWLTRDQEWSNYIRLPGKRVEDARGNAITDLNVMRRRVNGEWQYRKLTEDEQSKVFAENCW